MKVFHIFLILVLSPLFPGIINRVKAFFAGRKGPPLFQLYLDLFKLFSKDAVYSKTTTWIFRLGPIIALSSLIMALSLLPLAGEKAFFSFYGDLILFAYFLALARFFTVIAALDTGSSFEGMGASREVQFAVFSESSIFLVFIVLINETKSFSLSTIYTDFASTTLSHVDPSIILVGAALLIVFLVENCRIPVDDPNTHLELTMIHEVMVLDHGSVDLAYIFYGASLKLAILGALLVGLFVHYPFKWLFSNEIVFFFGMLVLAILIGIIESIIARLRLLKVIDLLFVAMAFSIFAFILQMR
jgi:formate hydrogenlyase subunit 4